MKYKFEDILLKYQTQVEYLKRNKQYFKNENISQALFINLSWFHWLTRSNLEIAEISIKELKPEIVAKYNTQENFPLLSLIFYRGEIIPVYDDDYGQQTFAVINGETISGGAYNFDYAYEFCEAVDRILEDKFLESGDKIFEDKTLDYHEYLLSKNKEENFDADEIACEAVQSAIKD